MSSISIILARTQAPSRPWSMQLKRFRCFGTDAGSGNEALVMFDVEAACWPPAERLAFAARQNANACVFIDYPQDPAKPYVLDFYYPHSRSPLCLHASLAAAHYLDTQGGARYSGSLSTAMTAKHLAFTRVGNELHIQVMPERVTAHVPATGEVAQWLDCAESAIKGPVAIASVGSAKLLVEMASSDELYALRPKLDEILDWGKRCGVSGIYAYVHRGADEYEGRNFNHRDECLEDTATGVAAGALCVLLKRDIVLHQGLMLDNHCRISARNDNGLISIGGLVHQA
ncbi:PhzF family phenazine biosynthesis protein [Pseudomonas piscis]|uniref:PhzF family phenazine biosynthesis protein n=1 Tax=Pseudomonas piscis TaxID=2614538 RepID=UPI0039A7580A